MLNITKRGVLNLLKNLSTINGVSLLSGGDISVSEITSISKSSQGYIKFKSGLVIQWGNHNTGTTSFPTSFPTLCAQVVVAQYSSLGSYRNPGATSINASSFYMNGESGVGYRWLAIGY